MNSNSVKSDKFSQLEDATSMLEGCAENLYCENDEEGFNHVLSLLEQAIDYAETRLTEIQKANI